MRKVINMRCVVMWVCGVRVFAFTGADFDWRVLYCLSIFGRSVFPRDVPWIVDSKGLPFST